MADDLGIELPVPQDRTPMEQEDAIASVRSAVWRRACMLGTCRFAGDDVSHENPPPVDSTTTCGGYEGFRYTHATGEPYWRWRICARHRDWWERRQAFKAAEKAGQGRQTGRGRLDDGGA
jgi:hypothetical protein